jgi:cell shape-determining protein MreC
MIRIFKIFIFFAIFSIFIYLSYLFDFLSFRSSFFFNLFDPVSIVLERPIKVQGVDLTKLRILENDNVSLKNEISRLNKELSTKVDYTNSYLEAKIISFEGDQMQIDHGSFSGIKQNQLVVSGNTLLGNVLTVTRNKALVALLNNTSSKNYCYTKQGQINVWGLLTGGKEGNILLTKISEEKLIDSGAKVYCEGFYAGKIKKIQKETSALFYQAEVEPGLDFQNLDTVYVQIQK